MLDDGREVRLAEIEVPPLPETDAAPGAVAATVALAQLGLWTNPYYDLLDADKPVGVVARDRRFALAKGNVVSVRVSGATSYSYVNFGRRWTEDFTVTILKRNARSFAAVGIEPKGLAGRRVRVWIEERRGPGSKHSPGTGE